MGALVYRLLNRSYKNGSCDFSTIYCEWNGFMNKKNM